MVPGASDGALSEHGWSDGRDALMRGCQIHASDRFLHVGGGILKFCNAVAAANRRAHFGVR
jgi:hypothetical protein